MPKKVIKSHGVLSGSFPSVIGMLIVLGCISGFVVLEEDFSKIALIPALIFGAILFFSEEKIEVNYREKIARHYLNLFIARVYSSKINLDKFDKVTLELFHELGKVESMSSRGSSSSLTKSYDIYLTNKNEKLLIYQFEIYKEAQKKLVYVAKKTNLPSEDKFLTRRIKSKTNRRR